MPQSTADTAAPITRTQAHLWRVESTPHHTLGELHVLGERFWVLERPWLQNASNVSCIPLGIYRAVFLPRSASGRYRRVYHVLSVPNRVGILQHAGNLVRHTLGCQLIGMRAGRLSGERAVLNSKTALAAYVELLGCAPVDLHVQMAA